ncbi:MAG: MFS transporter [bacterium]
MKFKVDKTILISTCHLYIHLGMLSLPAMFIPIMNYFKIGLGEVAWINTLALVAFGLGSLPAGFLIDRIGPKKILIINITGFSISLILASLVRSPLSLAITFCLAGAFGSLYHPTGLSYLSLTSTNTIKAMSIFGIFGNIGLGLGPLSANGLFLLGGWRLVFAGLGLIGLILLLFINITLNEVRNNKDNNIKRGFKHLLYYIPLFITATFIGFFINGITSLLPAFSYEKVSLWFSGVRQVVAGNITASIILFMGIIGQIFTAQLKSQLRLINYIIFNLLSLLIILILLALLPDILVIPLGLIMSPLYFAVQPLMNTLSGTVSSIEIRGSVYGIVFALYFGVGSLGTGFGGMIAEMANFRWTFILYALASFVALLLSLIMKKRYMLT